MNTSRPTGKHSYHPECGCNQCEPEVREAWTDSFNVDTGGGSIAMEFSVNKDDISGVEIIFSGFWPDDGALIEITLSDEEQQAMITIQKLSMELRGIL